MTSYSKFFNIAMENAICADIVHCGNTCWEMFHWNALHIFIGCCKYIGPISAVPILMKIHKINVDLLKQCGKNFLEYSLAAWLMGVCGLSFMCLYYKLFGKFYYWSVLPLPAATSASLCAVICSGRLITMFSRGLSTMVTQAIIKLYADNNILLRLLRDSRFALTFSFMCVNTSIIYTLLHLKSDVFWFINPFKKSSNFVQLEKIPSFFMDAILPAENHYCHHRNSCDQFIKEEICNYLKLGLGIEIIRVALGNWKEIVNKPLPFLAFNFISKMKFNFIGFLVGYTGSYRIFTCLLARRNKKDSSENHIISSFISGSFFCIYPQMSLFCHAFVTAMELTWKNCKTKCNNKLLAMLNSFSLPRMIFPILFGYICYLRAFYPWATPKLAMTILRGVTLNRESDIMEVYCTRLFGHSDMDVLHLFGRTSKE